MRVATRPLLARPIIIVGVPRSGTSMLFTLLSAAPGVFSLRTEGHEIWWEGQHHPSERGWDSDRLTAAEATPDVAAAIEQAFYKVTVPNRSLFRDFPFPGEGDQLTRVNRFGGYLMERNRAFRPLRELHIDDADPRERLLEEIKERARPIRIVDKTPKSCLRVSFIDAVFPDALFIYLKRDGRSNVNSLIEGWKNKAAGRVEDGFEGYSVPLELRIPGLQTSQWRYILPPGWRSYVDRPLEEVATFQWMESNSIAMEDLARVDPARVYTLFYEDLVAHTADQMQAICAFAGLTYAGGVRQLAAKPPVMAAHTPPEADKWRRQNGEAITRMVPVMAPLLARMGYDSVS